LLESLLMDYNKDVRPVKNSSDPLQVKFGANLCRLIDVDEVNQVLTTSLWLEMQWRDTKLVWNPLEWGGVERVHLPSDLIWIPDILLYNNADGEPHITISSLVLVDHKGTVLWQPPSIYKSLCPINIEYFPYDSQECHLKFGGWSNDGQTLALEQIPVNIQDVPGRRVDETGTEYLFLEEGLGLSFYHESAEWDLLSATSSRHAQIYPGCCGQQFYIDIRYNIVIRRKAIFFTVMLTIPCMLIANTTPFVFVVPPNEHKMTFSISIFVAFTVFYLVLIELIPPTSLALPLIGKYLLFTLMMITVSILISVVNINIYRRQAFASEMSVWQRWLFVKTLPRVLRLKTLLLQDQNPEEEKGHKEPSPFCSPRLRLLSLVEMDEELKKRSRLDNLDLVKKISDNLQIIAASFHNLQMEDTISDEWRLMSLVIDRVFLLLYIVMNLCAIALFVYNSPTLYDTRPILANTIPFSPLSGDNTWNSSF
uniref:Acetylcholine receptor subunit alpha-type unc-63 n=1 Tax=Heligmosomoides polygyrus TaxID=6339 RepID=A0A8L8KB14_HELPZ